MVADADAASRNVGDTVSEVLAGLREGGEDRARELARNFDEWDGPIVVDRDTIDQARAGLPTDMVDEFANTPEIIEFVGSHGVSIKWFGADDPVGFASRFDHWRYAPEQSLAETQQVLAGLCDMRIPLAMSSEQADQIVAIIARAVAEAVG